MIYIVTRENLLGGRAAASRIRCLAKAITLGGLDCEVLLIKQTRGNGVKNEGVFEGIKYRSMGKELSSKKTDLKRYLGYIHDDYKLCQFLSRNLKPGDVVFEYGPTIIHTHFVISIAHIKKAKFVRELCEYPFSTQKETLRAIIQRKIILKTQFRRYDGVVAISDTLVALSHKYCRDNTSIIKVPILVEFDKYFMDDESGDIAEPYIFHSGTLYEQKDGFVSMLKAFGIYCKSCKEPLKFISTGNIINSPHYKEIENVIEEYSLDDKVIYTGYLTNDQLQTYLKGASIVIINKYDNQQNKYCFSTKLAEYLAAGKAVIITNVGEAMNWLSDKHDSLIIPSGDLNQLASSILLLRTNEELRVSLGENAQNTCKKSFAHEIWASKLSDYFKRLK